MRKGFTMVELLAVIIIVGTVAILSFTSLTNTIKKNKIREQEVFTTNVINAAKLYMTSHLDDIDDFYETGDVFSVNDNLNLEVPNSTGAIAP